MIILGYISLVILKNMLWILIRSTHARNKENYPKIITDYCALIHLTITYSLI